MKQLFRIDLAAFDAARGSLVQVVEDLIKVNLFKAPYDEFEIEVPTRNEGTIIVGYSKHATIYDTDPKFDVGISYVSITRNGRTIHRMECLRFVHEFASEHGKKQALNQIELFYAELAMLIVLLSTKNIVKEVKHNSLVKFGVGKCKAEYVTTLRIGKITETDREHADTGRELRPHLRRGHIRNQHFGPNNSFHKQVWIQPVFVNSDKEYLPPGRVAYNVSMPRELNLTVENIND